MIEKSTGRDASIRGVPKWMEPRTGKQRSLRQEREVASKLDGKVQPGSGNQNHSPGDVKTKNVLLECKTTKHKSFRITTDLIRKVRIEAKSTNKEWAIVLDMDDTYSHTKERVVVLDLDLFTALMEQYNGFERHA